MGTLEYKTINNFLDKDIFLDLKRILFSNEMNWHWVDYQTTNDSNFFTNHLYKNHQFTSDIFIKHLLQIIFKLKINALINIRANLLVNKNKELSSNWHTDNGTNNSKTAILYMNNCNGYTSLKLNNDKETNIVSEENKILVFDNGILHRAVHQTDTERRIVINFNYY
jgi:hypothetical protein